MKTYPAAGDSYQEMVPEDIILVDYKTDYVEKGEEQKLTDKYQKQLMLYKEALEKALNRKVDKTIIYSTYLGEIELADFVEI